MVHTIASFRMGPGCHFGRDRARVAIAPLYMSTDSRPRNRYYKPKCGCIRYIRRPDACSGIDPKGVPHLFGDVAAYDKRLQQGQRIESEDV